MTTADTPTLRAAYGKLSAPEAPVPGYLAAILIAAIPTITDQTPALSRAAWNDDNLVDWTIVAVDGSRLVRIEVTGPAADGSERHPRQTLQAVAQKIGITSIAGSVTKVEATVKDTSTSWPERTLRWETTWKIHFTDGTELTVPNESEAKDYDNREKVEQFVDNFLAAALPR